MPLGKDHPRIRRLRPARSPRRGSRSLLRMGRIDFLRTQMGSPYLRPFALAFLLCGCASAPTAQSGNEVISPVQAVISAATAAPSGVRGTFEMDVRRVGRQDGNVYLDSESDYRDQRNLVIAVHPRAALGLREKFGQDIDKVAFGKRIRIYGEARRVKIVFMADGRATEDYYYQTHVDVWDSGQVVVLQ